MDRQGVQCLICIIKVTERRQKWKRKTVNKGGSEEAEIKKKELGLEWDNVKGKRQIRQVYSKLTVRHRMRDVKGRDLKSLI